MLWCISGNNDNARRAILLPFMQDGDNFFTRMDRQQQLKREQREREEAEAEAAAAATAAKLEAAELEAARVKAAEKEAEAQGSRHRPPNRDDEEGGSWGLVATGAGNGMDAGAGNTVPPEEERPPLALPLPLPLPREVEVNPLDDIDFKAIPADPMTVAETLVEVSAAAWWSSVW